MKKSKILLGVLSAMLVFASCSNGSDGTAEEKQKVKYYNPRSTESILYDHVDDGAWTKIATIPPKSEAEVEMDDEKAKRTWFQLREGVDWWITLWDTNPYYLDVTDIENGEKYLCVNSYDLTSELIEDEGYYSVAFHKVMNGPDGTLTFEETVDGQKKYIRRWPDLNAWVNDREFAENNLGKIVTITEDYFDAYTKETGFSRGWRTIINDTPYNHIVNRMLLTKK